MSRRSENPAPRQVFLSYSHRDLDFLLDFKPHLMAVKDQCAVLVWDDSEIELGEHWDDQISAAIAGSDLALLLVSPHFIASDFIMNQELPRLFSHFHERPAVAIPVYVKHSLADVRVVRFKTTKGEQQIRLTDMQGFIDPSKPLSQLPTADKDEAFADLTRKVLKLSDKLDGAFCKRLQEEQSRSKARRERASRAKERDSTGMALRFTGDLKDWTPEKEQQSVRRMARAVATSPEKIRVKKRRSGSVILEIELPVRAAFELIELAELGLFAPIGVEEVVWLEEALPAIETQTFQSARNESGSESSEGEKRSVIGASDSEIGSLIESISLDALGFLDEQERMDFETALNRADPTFRQHVRDEQSRIAQAWEVLLPEGVPAPELRQRVLSAIQEAQVQSQRAPDLIPMSRPRGVSRLWRAAALGMMAACVVLGVSLFNFLGRNASVPTTQVYRADFFLSSDAKQVQLKRIAVNTRVDAKLLRLPQRALLAVTAIDDSAILGLTVFFVDSKGNEKLVGKLEKSSEWGMHVLDMPGDVVALLDSGKIEIRTADGQAILQT